MHYPLFLGKHVVDDEYTNWLYKPFYFLSVVFGFVNTQGPLLTNSIAASLIPSRISCHFSTNVSSCSNSSIAVFLSGKQQKFIEGSLREAYQKHNLDVTRQRNGIYTLSVADIWLMTCISRFYYARFDETWSGPG